ncbi:MAG: DUF58 domain-containing protein [Hyphomicrobiaceae bacterium]
MIASRTSAGVEGRLLPLENEAAALVARLPGLVGDARRIAQTISHGVHGRRRAGPGETFWQFRQLQSGDTRTQIDWRRSAGSDRLYVREREWEAAHTVWLWIDLSASMVFRSHLGPLEKRDRALVLGFAAAELLVEAGERVGVIGLMPPTGRRRPSTVIAERLVEARAFGPDAPSLPPEARLSRFSECVILSDLLDPVEEMAPRFEAFAAAGVRGHLVQVLDPAEETLPYEGRTEFLGLEDGERILANRVESLREAYQSRLIAHRASIADLARRLEWSFLVHRTDRSAAETLLQLHARLSGELGGYRAPGSMPSGGEGR